MKTNKIEALKALLSAPKQIIIIPHINPDGDAVGSSLGLHHYLIKKGHKSTVIVPNDYPDFLKWMPGTDSIAIYENDTSSANEKVKDAEIIFTLDFNALNRIGGMQTIVSDSKAVKIMVDHHQQPDSYADFTFSDPSKSSTCEMIYDFIEMLGDLSLIDKEIANCLYAGIVTDTGSFRFSSTSSQTHRIVAHLIDLGISNNDIHNKIYDTNSVENLQLLGAALSNLKVLPDYHTAYISLGQDQLNKFNFKKGDTEGFVNYGLSIKGVVFAVIFIENSRDNIIKISFRSKGDFSVNEFAREHFNGGGHTNAAGGRSDDTMENTIEKFISILPDYKKALNQ